MIPIYLHITAEDINYLPYWKKILNGRSHPTPVSTTVPTIAMEVAMKAKEKGCSKIATTSPILLKMLLGSTRKVSVHDYAGSIIEKYGCEFLIMPPPEQCITTNAGEFLAKRYFSKFLSPEDFIPLPRFRWTLWAPQLEQQVKYHLGAAAFIAVDIETVIDDEDRSIDCVGFTFVRLNDKANSISLYTLVVSLDDPLNLPIVRSILRTRIPKLFQNGKYDINYLLRYSIPPVDYSFDTLNLFHSWYSELPKRLDFITAFLLHKWQFWKDDAKGSYDRMQHFEYNARDCYTTAMCFIALMREMPQYALENYKLEFPLVFPCLLAEQTGLGRDAEFMEEEERRFNSSMEERRKRISIMVGNKDFNPSSQTQVLQLFALLGSEDVKDTTPPSMDKVKHRHPLNRRILTEIQEYRKDRKLVSSYLRDEDPKTKKRKTWHGRMFYSLNPHATDTGRLASTESAFWCGWQIQNIPRGRKDIQIKRGIISDPGFYFGECDRSQAETRDTAYLSGDVGLLAAVEDRTKDFHGHNAAAFFGLPYEAIVNSFQGDDEVWVHKKLDEQIRDLSKRTNHGANYNMAANMLLMTMGIDNVVRAQSLLNLPRAWSLVQVTGYLLERFDKTYPTVRGPYYDHIKASIRATHKLVGPTGWTRYCFGTPWNNKQDMNAYAAHPSQSLNAMELNVAYLRVFKEVALVNPKDFKLGPQVHDSILFQYRHGHIDLVYKVAECMDNPISVTDIFGKIRTLKIPVDIKGEADRWSEVKTLPMRRPELLVA